MEGAGTAEVAFEKLAIFKPGLETQAVKLLAPHECQDLQTEKRGKKPRAASQEYLGLYKSEADFLLHKGALVGFATFGTDDSEIQDLDHTEEVKRQYVRQLVEAMANMDNIADNANHHHVLAVQAMSSTVLEELAWEIYVSSWSTRITKKMPPMQSANHVTPLQLYARDAQIGRTGILPWNTSFTWKSYESLDARMEDIENLLWVSFYRPL